MIDKAVRTLFMKTESAVLTAADGVRRAWHQAGQTLTGNTVRIEGRGVRLEGEEKFKRRRLRNAVQLELPAADDVAQPVGLPEKRFQPCPHGFRSLQIDQSSSAVGCSHKPARGEF